MRGGEERELCDVCMSTQTAAIRRAYTQPLVTTRLLDSLHDPIAQISRLQRVYPRAWLNDNPLTRCLDFSETPVVSPLRYMARGLFVSDYDVRDKNVAFRHGF